MWKSGSVRQHAQANVRATICVPRSVDSSKLIAMVNYGADVRISEFDGYDHTETWAQDLARAEARTFISAFDDYDIMAANGGTVAKEVLEDAPDARRFVLPIGGGGLGAGFAFWIKHRLSEATIVACQHELSPGLPKSLEAGRAVTKLPAVETMAGGVEGGIGSLTFEVLRPLIDHIALVAENEILEAVRWMLAHHQYLIEPTAAVALAACLTGKVEASEQPTVIVITGRNVSAESVKKILLRILTLDQIRASLDDAKAIDCMRAALIAHARGECSTPMPMHLETLTGEVHMKSSYRRGGKHFVLKMASTIAGRGNGMMLLADAGTGEPVVYLADARPSHRPPHCRGRSPDRARIAAQRSDHGNSGNRHSSPPRRQIPRPHSPASPNLPVGPYVRPR